MKRAGSWLVAGALLVALSAMSNAQTCWDEAKNGDETDVDCGGPDSCPCADDPGVPPWACACLGSICSRCADGRRCLRGSDCESKVCRADNRIFCAMFRSCGGVCANHCENKIRDGDETGTDCGGTCARRCPVDQPCRTASDCETGRCADGGVCRVPCGGQQFRFSVDSSTGNAIGGAAWPAGQDTQGANGCTVTINRPGGRIDLVGLLEAGVTGPFSVAGWSGFSRCWGFGGEDGDGCRTVSCPFAGIPFCEAERPSCSVALNGMATAEYTVMCSP